jgi:predicted RNA-binding Zn-ribbon protein involved in translation (DUF1610 family)
MSISFTCPQCGKKLKAPDNAVGKTSRCLGCGSPVTCPEPIYDAELADPSALIPGGVDPYGDLNPDQPYALVEPPAGAAAAPAAESRRPCPMCGEMILTTAAKCRYCGEIFDPTLRKAERKKSKYGPEAESLSAGDILIGLLCSGIGCIAGLVWMVQGKPKGLKMVGLSLIADVVKSVIIAVIRSSQPGAPGP